MSSRDPGALRRPRGHARRRCSSSPSASPSIGLGADASPRPRWSSVGLVLLGFGNGAVDVMMNVEGAAIEKQSGKTILPLFHAFFSFGTVIGAGLGVVAIAPAHRRAPAPRDHRASLIARRRGRRASRTCRRARRRWTRQADAEQPRLAASACASRCRPGGSRAPTRSASSCSAWRSPRAARTTGSRSASSRVTARGQALGAAGARRLLGQHDRRARLRRSARRPLRPRRDAARAGGRRRRRAPAVHPRAEPPARVRRRGAVGRRASRSASRSACRPPPTTRPRPPRGSAPPRRSATSRSSRGPPLLGFISEHIGLLNTLYILVGADRGVRPRLGGREARSPARRSAPAH